MPMMSEISGELIRRRAYAVNVERADVLDVFALLVFGAKKIHPDAGLALVSRGKHQPLFSYR